MAILVAACWAFANVLLVDFPCLGAVMVAEMHCAAVSDKFQRVLYRCTGVVDLNTVVRNSAGLAAAAEQR